MGWRRAISVLSIGWLLFLLEPLSSPGLDFGTCIVTFGATLLFGAVWLGLLLTRRPIHRLGLVAWFLYPVAALALLFLFVSSQSPANPLFRLRFLLSRPALEASSRSALAGAPVATPAWVGLFKITRVDARQPDVWLISGGCGVVDECGLAYVPGPRPSGRKTRLTPLGGPWYHLYSVF